METITVICVGMGYDDKRVAVERFWNDAVGEIDVERGLFLSFHPSNPHDKDAIAVVYCSEWIGEGVPTVQNIWTSDVDADGVAPYIIGYITRDGVPNLYDFLDSLMDNDWADAEVTFTIDEARMKGKLPTWMILTLTVHD